MRILLLTRHYPPAVSGGAKRPYLLARALRSAGVEVRVCAPSIPEGEPGWAVPHANRDPSPAVGKSSLGLRDVAREFLLWPDPDIRWCLRAADSALADRWKPDWVFSTSPPESIHVAGERIARRTGARWLADFRDLWLQSPHRRERLLAHRRMGERVLARRLLPKADLVTAVDSVVASEARTLGAGRVEVLPHFAPTALNKKSPDLLPAETINIVHAGSVRLSDPEARIEDLLGPFELAQSKNAALRLFMVGRLTNAECEAIQRSRAAASISVVGVVPLDRAYEYMRSADALTFVASAKMHVPPSKITDYLMFDAPIIACGVGPWRADTRFSPDHPESLMSALRKGQVREDLTRPLLDTEAVEMLLRWMRATAP